MDLDKQYLHCVILKPFLFYTDPKVSNPKVSRFLVDILDGQVSQCDVGLF